MTINTFGTLHVLIQHAKKEELKQFLSDRFFETQVPSKDIPLKSLSYSMYWLSLIHPTWIHSAMQGFPKSVQSQLLAWFPASLVQELKSLLSDVPIAHKRCSSIGAFYLLDLLAKKLRPPGLVEEVFLTESSFYPLLYFSGQTKMTLINCLGLYALAKEMKNIVDKVLIERIHKVLSPTERLFLSYCQAHPMKYLDTTDFLSSWDADDELHRFVHRQGLVFLATALVKEDASFLWYFLRRLDIDRGYIFEQALHKVQDHPHVEYFQMRLKQDMQVLVK